MSAGCEQCGRPLSTYSKEDETTCSDGEDCLGYRLGRATARVTALSQLLSDCLPFVEASDSYSRQRGAFGETTESDLANRIRTTLTSGAAAPVDETEGEG